MTRMALLSDEMWARVEPLLPPVKGAMGRPMREHRCLVEGAIYRYRTGIAWRDLPAEFGPWQTVWKRHHRFLHRRHLGQVADRVAGAGGRQGADRLAAVGRLHQRPGPPARRDRFQVSDRTDLAHRGHHRMTRIRALGPANPATTPSGAPAAA